jgi:predicted enzyme related to lactoylglutathione lyase
LPVGAPRGAGVLLYYRVPDVRAAYAKAEAMGAVCEAAPAFIRLAGHTEFVVRSPDGYALALYQRGEV